MILKVYIHQSTSQRVSRMQNLVIKKIWPPTLRPLCPIFATLRKNSCNILHAHRFCPFLPLWVKTLATYYTLHRFCPFLPLCIKTLATYYTPHKLCLFPFIYLILLVKMKGHKSLLFSFCIERKTFYIL